MQENQEKNEALSLDNVNFLWNDVAAVNDENCQFIICKTMLQLPKEKGDIASVDETEVKDILGEFTQGELSGKLILAIAYTDEAGEKEEINLAVPFIVDYQGDMSRGSVLEENYAVAQKANNRYILLETVTSVPKKNIPTRSLAKIGHFERKNRIVLPEDWPDMEQIIGANIVYDQAQFRAENDQAILDMTGHIGIIYAQNAQAGEKIVYYQTEEPFSIALEQALLEAEVGYYSLNAQLINEREIALQSFNHLYGETLAAEEEKEEKKELSQQEETAETTAPAEETQAVQEEADNDAPQTQEEEKEPTPSTATPKRVNRRESLGRHMHSLDRGVKTSHIVRNIEFNK